MGMEWDWTPPASWIGAKVYAEYGIMLVNAFIRRDCSTEIPMPIGRAFAQNIQRAFKALPKEMMPDQKRAEYEKQLETASEPLMATSPLESGRLAGTIPLAKLENALEVTRKIFARAYACHFFAARRKFFSYNNYTTSEGVVDEWDSERFNSPEEDPNAKITPWEQANIQIMRELDEVGWIKWELNETEIYTSMYYDGPYAGHVVSSGRDAKTQARAVKTEYEFLQAAQGQQGTNPANH